jgi:hypothetical protein
MIVVVLSLFRTSANSVSVNPFLGDDEGRIYLALMSFVMTLLVLCCCRLSMYRKSFELEAILQPIRWLLWFSVDFRVANDSSIYNTKGIATFKTSVIRSIFYFIL